MVGEILRREREKQGLSIADVAGETSIRDVYLEAIEKGDYDALQVMYMPRALSGIIPSSCR